METKETVQVLGPDPLLGDHLVAQMTVGERHEFNTDTESRSDKNFRLTNSSVTKTETQRNRV